MASYTVSYKMDGCLYFDVEAESEEEAKRLASYALDEYLNDWRATDFDWIICNIERINGDA